MGVRKIIVQTGKSGNTISWPTGDPDIAEIEIHRMDEENKIEILTKMGIDENRFTDNKMKLDQVYSYCVVSISKSGQKSTPSEWVVVTGASKKL